MRLIVAEKPSLARAIAAALPGPKVHAKTHIRVGDDVVAWCAGHILELAPPNGYEEHDPNALPDAFYLRVAVAIGGRLPALEILRSLLARELLSGQAMPRPRTPPVPRCIAESVLPHDWSGAADLGGLP